MQGDDYILYCHPSRQKTPRSDRLREWYLTLLRTAKAEGTVAHLSNLFDTFFEGGRDHRVERASITHMPYFEGARAMPLLSPVVFCSLKTSEETVLWNRVTLVPVLNHSKPFKIA